MDNEKIIKEHDNGYSPVAYGKTTVIELMNRARSDEKVAYHSLKEKCWVCGDNDAVVHLFGEYDTGAFGWQSCMACLHQYLSGKGVFGHSLEADLFRSYKPYKVGISVIESNNITK